MCSFVATTRSVIEVQTPNAADKKSYGVGPASVPPALTGSSAINRCGPASMSFRSEAPARTMTGCMVCLLHEWTNYRPDGEVLFCRGCDDDEDPCVQSA